MRRVAASLLALAAPALAAAGAEGFPRGELVDPIACAAAPGQSYALYLPALFSPDRPWPAVVVLDPRGRGKLAAELFRPGAERWGYVVVSSNNTLSDGPSHPNLEALKALAAELPRHAVDPRRVVLAGFSGTARAAWSVAAGLGDGVAGVIGASGALPGPFDEWKQVRFPFFGTAGDADFNWAEMRALQPLLDSIALPNRIEFFEGGHSWPPPEILTDALGWMEVHAMEAARRPVDLPLAEALFREGLAAARALEAAGKAFEARRRYLDLAGTFVWLLDAAEAAGAARRLERDPLAVRQAEAIARAAREERSYADATVGALARRLGERRGQPPTVSRILADLRVERLLRTAAEASERGASARRMLEIAHVQLAFYLPRDLEAKGDAPRAQACKDAASEIRARLTRGRI